MNIDTNGNITNNINPDENGNVTIKCNKHYSTERCFPLRRTFRRASLCPFRVMNGLHKEGNECNNGIVTLNWLDYIQFNNYMTKEFKKD